MRCRGLVVPTRGVHDRLGSFLAEAISRGLFCLQYVQPTTATEINIGGAGEGAAAFVCPRDEATVSLLGSGELLGCL